MLEEYKSRTDLALEANEQIKDEGKQRGIIVHENYDELSGLKITCIDITDSNGEKALGRKMGRYVTAENMELATADSDQQNYMADRLAGIMSGLIKSSVNTSAAPHDRIKILVVGLGNKEVTPDSLGPLVTEYVSVLDYGDDEPAGDTHIRMTAIAPGVMAQTGMETAVIVRGIVASSRPDVVIAIDALAARSSARLNTTVQLSDRGINPGSGVGNHRMGLTRESVGVPVIAVGIPTVIEAATIVHDAIVNFTKAFAGSDIMGTMNDVMDSMTEKERRALMLELIAPSMSTMYVTPRDVDAAVQRTAYIVARALDRLPDIMTTV